MIEILNFIVNTHDKRSRDFIETLPNCVKYYCFYTQLGEPEVARHYDETSEYPYIAHFPALVVKVPAYTYHSRTVTILDENGAVELHEYPEVTIQEHYECLEPCATYEIAIQAVSKYNANLKHLS